MPQIRRGDYDGVKLFGMVFNYVFVVLILFRFLLHLPEYAPEAVSATRLPDVANGDKIQIRYFKQAVQKPFALGADSDQGKVYSFAARIFLGP